MPKNKVKLVNRLLAENFAPNGVALRLPLSYLDPMVAMYVTNNDADLISVGYMLETLIRFKPNKKPKATVSFLDIAAAGYLDDYIKVLSPFYEDERTLAIESVTLDEGEVLVVKFQSLPLMREVTKLPLAELDIVAKEFSSVDFTLTEKELKDFTTKFVNDLDGKSTLALIQSSFLAACVSDGGSSFVLPKSTYVNMLLGLTLGAVFIDVISSYFAIESLKVVGDELHITTIKAVVEE